jgi:hypothetical protein
MQRSDHRRMDLAKVFFCEDALNRTFAQRLLCEHALAAHVVTADADASSTTTNLFGSNMNLDDYRVFASWITCGPCC